MSGSGESLAGQRALVTGASSATSPGAIKIPINASAWNTPEAKRSLLRLIPYGRVGDPIDIGRAVVWLASDDPDYVTGATLYVDGGMTLFPEFRFGG
jgi:glucose 1-dehydrogenase